MKGKVTDVSRYKVQQEDWAKYMGKIEDFCSLIQGELVK
jgi:hypothetical protein